MVSTKSDHAILCAYEKKSKGFYIQMPLYFFARVGYARVTPEDNFKGCSYVHKALVRARRFQDEFRLRTLYH